MTYGDFVNESMHETLQNEFIFHCELKINVRLYNISHIVLPYRHLRLKTRGGKTIKKRNMISKDKVTALSQIAGHVSRFVYYIVNTIILLIKEL